jgi:hypothetical protein
MRGFHAPGWTCSAQRGEEAMVNHVFRRPRLEFLWFSVGVNYFFRAHARL